MRLTCARISRLVRDLCATCARPESPESPESNLGPAANRALVCLVGVQARPAPTTQILLRLGARPNETGHCCHSRGARAPDSISLRRANAGQPQRRSNAATLQHGQRPAISAPGPPRPAKIWLDQRARARPQQAARAETIARVKSRAQLLSRRTTAPRTRDLISFGRQRAAPGAARI